MIDIRPFKGFRYRLAHPEDLGRFISPPYDMLTPAMVDGLMAADAHNIVRIIQNKPQAGDTCNRDRHIRAGRLLKQWIAEAVLARDDAPSVYVYRQRFAPWPGAPVLERTGVVARVRISEFGKGPVYPHENTLAAPKADRFEHMEAINGNTEIIFGLLTDDGAVYDAIRACCAGDRAGVALDADGVEHELRRMEDPQIIGRLAQAVAPQQIVIADGHHRYETAVRFRDQYHIDGSEYVMMSLVSMRDPGLVIRPFHRILRTQPTCSPAQMRARLAEFFHLEDAGAATAQRVRQMLDSSARFDAIFAPAGGSLAALSLNASGERLLAGLRNGMSPAWNHLNVSIINSVVINTILGLPLDGAVLHDAVEYEKDPLRALTLCAEAGAFYGCFFIRPLTIDAVRAIVAGGERMPQKSTNFFPKFYSGLVLNLMGRS